MPKLYYGDLSLSGITNTTNIAWFFLINVKIDNFLLV